MKHTYQSIKNLLVDSQIEGQTMACRFRVPGTDKVVESKSMIRKSNSVQSQMASTVKDSLAREVRSSVFGLIRNTLGYSAMGRLGTSIASSVLSQPDALISNFSAEEKQAAIVEAFQGVASYFFYNASAGQWQAAGTVSGFEQQLASHPLQSQFEKDLLARMIIQLACADGNFSEKEREMLEEQLGLSNRETDELFLAEQPVLAVECEEVAEANRPTLFLLAYTATLADQRLHDNEKELLDQYAGMLGLPEEKVGRLASMAKDHILLSLFSLRSSQEELAELATQFQMEPIEVQRAWVRYKKSNMEGGEDNR